MNITFQTLKNTGYRPQVTTQSKYTPRAEKARGDYDTVNIRRPQAAQDDEESFARMLAQRTAAQIGEGASPERVKDLSTGSQRAPTSLMHSESQADCLV